MRNTFAPNPLRIIYFLLFALSVVKASAISATVKGSLPSVVNECSGVDYAGNSSFWTHNDGYGDNRLYKISSAGVLQQTITISGATNYDWEDLTHDAARNYLFIGDFGNNNCSRTNLKIYRINYPNSSTTTTTAQAINFTFSDQSSFPSLWMNFDVESFFHYDGNIYLFTKTDGLAVGYTKMYRLPENPGTYTAMLVDSFFTNDRITSADISPDANSMILMSNSHIHIFKNFPGSNFFAGNHTQVNISGSWTQKEGLSYVSNNEIYVTDENNGSGNYLYYFNLSAYIPAGLANGIGEVNEPVVSVFPNPVNDKLHFDFDKNYHSIQLLIFDITGKTILNSENENTQSIIYNVNGFSRGIYFYKIIVDGKINKSNRFIIE